MDQSTAVLKVKEKVIMKVKLAMRYQNGPTRVHLRTVNSKWSLIASLKSWWSEVDFTTRPRRREDDKRTLTKERGREGGLVTWVLSSGSWSADDLNTYGGHASTTQESFRECEASRRPHVHALTVLAVKNFWDAFDWGLALELAKRWSFLFFCSSFFNHGPAVHLFNLKTIFKFFFQLSQSESTTYIITQSNAAAITCNDYYLSDFEKHTTVSQQLTMNGNSWTLKRLQIWPIYRSIILWQPRVQRLMATTIFEKLMHETQFLISQCMRCESWA